MAVAVIMMPLPDLPADRAEAEAHIQALGEQALRVRVTLAVHRMLPAGCPEEAAARAPWARLDKAPAQEPEETVCCLLLAEHPSIMRAAEEGEATAVLVRLLPQGVWGEVEPVLVLAVGLVLLEPRTVVVEEEEASTAAAPAVLAVLASSSSLRPSVT